MSSFPPPHFFTLTFSEYYSISSRRWESHRRRPLVSQPCSLVPWSHLWRFLVYLTLRICDLCVSVSVCQWEREYQKVVGIMKTLSSAVIIFLNPSFYYQELSAPSTGEQGCKPGLKFRLRCFLILFPGANPSICECQKGYLPLNTEVLSSKLL